MARVESLVRPCKINYLVLRYRHVGKKSAAGLYLSPNKNKYNGKKSLRSNFRAFYLGLIKEIQLQFHVEGIRNTSDCTKSLIPNGNNR